MVEALNVLDVQWNVTNDDHCGICHSGGQYNDTQWYILPECKHCFHTTCILTWFRMGNNRCPYCGNNGINHNEEGQLSYDTPQIGYLGTNSNYKPSRYWSRHKQQTLNFIKQYSRKNEAPDFLKRKIQDLSKLEKKRVELQKQHKEYSDLTKEPKSYTNSLQDLVKEYHNNRSKGRRAIYRCSNKISQLKNNLVSLPIVPIIIPTQVDMS